MTDAIEHGALAADPAIVAAQIDADGAQAGAEESTEVKAHRQGWRPEEQFKGPKDKWVDAATFLERGEKYAPFIQAENKKLEKALDKARAEIDGMKGQIRDLGAFASKAAENAYKNAMRDFEADLEVATAAGDVNGVKAVSKAMVAYEKEAAPEPAAKGPDPDWQSAEAEWKAANTWFDGNQPGNRAMTTYALDLDAELRERSPTLSAKARLAEVTKGVKAEFPERFTNPAREAAAAVEGASGARRSTGREYSNLPPEAKAFCDKIVKQGTMTREAYVKAYQW